MNFQRVDKNSTIRITAIFTDGTGARLTGLTPTLRVSRDSDGNYQDKDDSTFGATPDDWTMTERNATHSPGEYYLNWVVPDAFDTYTIRADGGSTAKPRYHDGRIAGDITADAVAGNKLIHEISDQNLGRLTVYDKDGTTIIGRLTPTLDDDDNPTQRELTPE